MKNYLRTGKKCTASRACPFAPTMSGREGQDLTADFQWSKRSQGSHSHLLVDKEGCN